jgi:hypothetical protein
MQIEDVVELELSELADLGFEFGKGGVIGDGMNAMNRRMQADERRKRLLCEVVNLIRAFREGLKPWKSEHDVAQRAESNHQYSSHFN